MLTKKCSIQLQIDKILPDSTVTLQPAKRIEKRIVLGNHLWYERQ